MRKTMELGKSDKFEKAFEEFSIKDFKDIVKKNLKFNDADYLEVDPPSSLVADASLTCVGSSEGDACGMKVVRLPGPDLTPNVTVQKIWFDQETQELNIAEEV